MTIAGFAALVSVLGNRNVDFNPVAEGLRLVVSLECSLFVAVFALLPMVPEKFGLADDLAWRFSAAAYLASDVAFALLIAGRIRTVPDLWPNRSLPRLIWSGSALGELSLLAAASGLFSAPPQAFYFLALYINLLNAGLSFLVVAWQTFVPNRPPPV